MLIERDSAMQQMLMHNVRCFLRRLESNNKDRPWHLFFFDAIARLSLRAMLTVHQRETESKRHCVRKWTLFISTGSTFKCSHVSQLKTVLEALCKCCLHT